MAPERRARELLERFEGWAFESCEVSQDWETPNGVEILLNHLRVHFERQSDEEACLLKAKEAADDELEAKHQEAVALTTITDYGGERREGIPSLDEIDAWWKAGLLDPSEGETKESSHAGRWRQQKAVNWEQVTEELHSSSVTTCPSRGGSPIAKRCVDPINGYSSSCSPGSEGCVSSETIEVVKPGSQDQVQSRTLERLQDELDEVIQSIPQERISEHITDRNV